MTKDQLIYRPQLSIEPVRITTQANCRDFINSDNIKEKVFFANVATVGPNQLDYRVRQGVQDVFELWMPERQKHLDVKIA